MQILSKTDSKRKVSKLDLIIKKKFFKYVLEETIN